MLPANALTTLKRSTVAALAALSIVALPASPAHAWGEKEQSFVAGVAAAVIADQIIKQVKRNNRAPAPMYYVDPQPQPVYRAPTHQQPSASIYNTAAARAFQSYSSAERRLIQKRLAAYGYYSGRADGAFGPATYRAVVAFARDEGAVRNLESTGGAYTIYDGLIY
ncbi:MAG: peptidoglycan-binding domain-containing protein [Pseudomonadota bacterium]